MGRPIVRNESNASWIDVFCKGGWKMKTYEYGYITMTAQNTKIRNADNTGWISFSCPIPVPVDVTRGRVQGNRILDSAGYLWCAGYGVGVYEDNTLRSYTWQKVKTGYGVNATYINNIKAMSAGGGFHDMYNPCTLYTFDDRVLFAGYGSLGHRGNGTFLAPSAEYNYGRWQIVDVTDKWNQALGNVTEIARHDPRGAIVMSDGRPFVIGYCEYRYTYDAINQKQLGFSGVPPLGSYSEGHVVVGLSHTWQRPKIGDGTVMQQVVQMIRTPQNHSLALLADGTLMQAALWQASATQLPLLPTPKSNTNEFRPSLIPFTGGVIKNLHQGGVIETTTGSLFYHSPKRVYNDNDFFYGFEFINTGVNINVYDSPVVKIAFDWRVVSGAYRPCLFILLEDGRLYASGDNTDGWFGIGALTSVPIGSPTLINNNVFDFDIEVGNCILTKKDNTIWGSGLNQYGRLGIGNTVKTREWRQGIITNKA